MQVFQKLPEFDFTINQLCMLALKIQFTQFVSVFAFAYFLIL